MADLDSTDTEQQNRQYIAEGGSDEDSGDSGESNPPISDEELQAWAKTPDYKFLPNAGTTIAGKSDTPAAQANEDKPGVRTQNPLGNFSSYTYQLTLYMITPDAYQAFVESDRTSINAINNTTSPQAAASVADTGNGAFVVAQSGGINNSVQKRAPGMDLDYYIDDLKIVSAINGKNTKSESNTTKISFTIYEPYGFSFVTKLQQAAITLQNASKSANFSKLVDPTRQFFVLGIKFQGYDLNGKVLTGAEHFASDTFNPAGNSSGVYERFYDILIDSFKFKLDGKATTYHITAATAAAGTVLGAKMGLIDKGATIVAEDVMTALIGDDPGNNKIGLLTKLNNDQLELSKNGSITKGMETTYSVKFLGDNADLISDATIVSKADLDKLKWAMNPTVNTKDVNAILEEFPVENSNLRQIVFRQGTPISQAISAIISQSSYLESALSSIIKSGQDPEDNSEDKITNKNKNTLRWFNICPEIKCKGWDPLRSDFAYDITYIIQPYETPVAISPFANKLTPYYGPHKRYDYWFTGKNSEILSYEQNQDNTFFQVVLDNTDEANRGSGGASQVPTKVGGPQNYADQGKRDTGFQNQANYLTSLFDPGARATAKIQILGDPDYLMQDTVSSVSEVYNQFYGSDGFTINPNGGQVFIEINFNEAVDYKNSTGTLDINNKILFWAYPPGVKVQGVSYMVQEVVSTFSKGKFIQDLKLIINTFDSQSDFIVNGTSETGREIASENLATSTPGSTPPVDEFAGLDEAVAQQSALNEAAAADAFYNPATGTQQTSPTGGASDSAPVQDGDATSSAGTKQVEEAGRE